jgi:hypothetical protein
VVSQRWDQPVLGISPAGRKACGPPMTRWLGATEKHSEMVDLQLQASAWQLAHEFSAPGESLGVELPAGGFIWRLTRVRV